MRKILLMVVVLALSGCALNAVTVTERGYVFGEPVEQLVTTVCNPSGYEVTTVQTFVAGENGARLIDTHAAGGPGIGYAIGTAATAGTGAAVTGGLLNIQAARELRPDQTNVQQTGGGAEVTATGGTSVATGGTAIAHSDAEASVHTANQNINTNSLQQTQAQQQQQQQQQHISQPATQPQRPTCNTPQTGGGVSPQNQNQNQTILIR